MLSESCSSIFTSVCKSERGSLSLVEYQGEFGFEWMKGLLIFGEGLKLWLGDERLFWGVGELWSAQLVSVWKELRVLDISQCLKINSR